MQKGYDGILLSRREFVPLGCVAVIQPVYYLYLLVWHLPASVSSHLTKTSVGEGTNTTNRPLGKTSLFCLS